jgi:hypothetical protein
VPGLLSGREFEAFVTSASSGGQGDTFKTSKKDIKWISKFFRETYQDLSQDSSEYMIALNKCPNIRCPFGYQLDISEEIRLDIIG